MNKYMLFLILVVAVFAGCKQKEQVKTVDLAAVEDTVSIEADKFHSAYASNDLNTYSAYLLDDVLVCGTDPRELWSKKQFAEYRNDQFPDSVILETIPLQKEIKVSPDGKSAIVVVQLFVPAISSKIPVRNITHMLKAGDKWKIDFISFSLITENENIEKLDMALTK
ncbi:MULTISPECIES: nuclear transport factor 2 family protein [Proteiniphilum]|jgi:ketosteroid isomerase-like protein|uniref:nuclear transport factor 2 family protein n=1 Tax=Proteiniphilum TaxID=294702 RepID=UPI001EEC48DD|nr:MULTISPECIES: nuclear transport factor 2 family protein [Proteiniphilum]MDD3909604.1 nuclear transport factor 2 family protein [Proteiniphilum sp.]ULB33557.1 nuclear transport factor 2 family protein [Proteiniphilum propionicum]